MVHHIVIWDLKEALSEEEKKQSTLKFKEMLLALKDSIPGIINLELVTEPLKSSNGALMLVSSFESVEAMNNYQAHPEHVKASQFAGAFVKNRKCVDYEA